MPNANSYHSLTVLITSQSHYHLTTPVTTNYHKVCAFKNMCAHIHAFEIFVEGTNVYNGAIFYLIRYTRCTLGSLDGIFIYISIDACSKEVYSDKSPKLIVSNRSNIVSVDLDTSFVDQYEGIHCYVTFGVDYDLVNRVIYWSEIHFGLIRRVSFDNSFNGSAVETIVTGLGRPEQIAVDWVNRKLYWADRSRFVIERSDLDGRNIELFIDRIIPQAIAIDPFHKTIYWTNLHTKSIEKAPMIGKLKQSIVTVANPSGLTLDYDNNLLYWTDRDLNQILSCDLEGNNMKVIPVSVVITNPYAITVFKSNLYWTDRSNSHIDRVNQFTGRSEGNISVSLNRPTDIDVLDSSRQPGACMSHNG